MQPDAAPRLWALTSCSHFPPNGHAERAAGLNLGATIDPRRSQHKLPPAARSSVMLDRSSTFFEIVGIDTLHMIRPCRAHTDLEIDHEFGQSATVNQHHLGVDVIHVCDGVR